MYGGNPQRTTLRTIWFLAIENTRCQTESKQNKFDALCETERLINNDVRQLSSGK